MLVIRTSQLTGRMHALELPITLSELQRWQEGLAIQLAMPDLTQGEREFMLTGITEQEWEDEFGNIHAKKHTMQTRMKTFRVNPSQRAVVTDLLSQAITGEFIAMSNFASLADTTSKWERKMEAVENAWISRSRAEGFINLATQFNLKPEGNPEGEYWKAWRTCFLQYARKQDYVGCLILQMLMAGSLTTSIYDDVGVELDNKMGEFFCILAEEQRELMNGSFRVLNEERGRNPGAFIQKLEEVHWEGMPVLARWLAGVDLGGHCGICQGSCMKGFLPEINLTMEGLRERALIHYAGALQRVGIPEERSRAWIEGLPGSA